MVVGTFPIAKLGMLAVKHVGKTFTGVIMRTAKRSPTFKTVVVAPAGALYNNISVRSKMWMLGQKQPRSVPPLNDSTSVQMGSDLLGEICVFLTGALLMILEFSRQGRNERLKKEKSMLEQEQLERKISCLTGKVIAQTKEICRLKTMIESIDRSYDYDCNC